MAPPSIPDNTKATILATPFPTPTIDADGTFTVVFSTHIGATPRTCLDALLHATEYSKWNRFCRKCTIDKQPPASAPASAPAPAPASASGSASSKRSSWATKPVAESSAAGNSRPTSFNSSASSNGANPARDGPDFLRLGTKFTFDVHMNDPATSRAASGSGRPTQLQVSVLERIDEKLVEVPNKASAISTTGSGLEASSSSSPVPPSSSLTKATKHAAAAHKKQAVKGGERVTADDDDKNDPDAPFLARFTVDPTPRRPKERRKGWRVAWQTRPSMLLPAWALRSERVHELVAVAVPFGPREEPETVCLCWETFHGKLAPLLRSTLGASLCRGFDVWAVDLKARAEDLQRERTRGGAFAEEDQH